MANLASKLGVWLIQPETILDLWASVKPLSLTEEAKLDFRGVRFLALRHPPYSITCSNMRLQKRFWSTYLMESILRYSTSRLPPFLVPLLHGRHHETTPPWVRRRVVMCRLIRVLTLNAAYKMPWRSWPPTPYELFLPGSKLTFWTNQCCFTCVWFLFCSHVLWCGT